VIYKNSYFPKLLDNPNVSPEDKQKITELLKKPWNPYVVGRHTSLTQKSRILKESTHRIFSGWTANSDMPRRYIHLFGNAACEDILQAYGLVEKDQQTINKLQSKQCPNCSEPNKPDSKFCAKCRMVLTYDAYSETIEEKHQKESEVKELKNKYEQDMKALRGEIREEMKKQLAQKVTQLKPEVEYRNSESGCKANRIIKDIGIMRSSKEKANGKKYILTVSNNINIGQM
jgi:hypothetical protein